MNMRGDAKNRAYTTLKHYIKLVWDNAGLKWNGDNDDEIMGIVEDLLEAATEEKEIKKLGIKCDSCGYVAVYADRDMQEVAKEHPAHCAWARRMLGKPAEKSERQ